MSAQPVDFDRVLDLCGGMPLNEIGRIIEHDLRKYRAGYGDDYLASAERLARNVLAEYAASRKRLTPMVCRVARCGGGQ